MKKSIIRVRNDGGKNAANLQVPKGPETSTGADTQSRESEDLCTLVLELEEPIRGVITLLRIFSNQRANRIEKSDVSQFLGLAAGYDLVAFDISNDLKQAFLFAQNTAGSFKNIANDKTLADSGRAINRLYFAVASAITLLDAIALELTEYDHRSSDGVRAPGYCSLSDHCAMKLETAFIAARDFWETLCVTASKRLATELEAA